MAYEYPSPMPSVRESPRKSLLKPVPDAVSVRNLRKVRYLRVFPSLILVLCMLRSRRVDRVSPPPYRTHLSKSAGFRCFARAQSYGPTSILKGLSMSVPAGSIYGLLGPSGCGKTTFLKILLGRLSADLPKPDSDEAVPCIEVFARILERCVSPVVVVAVIFGAH